MGSRHTNDGLRALVAPVRPPPPDVLFQIGTLTLGSMHVQALSQGN
jgi:hypothetical protein